MTAETSTPGHSRLASAVRGGLWSAASQVLPAIGTAGLSVAAGRYLGSGPLGEQSLIAYLNSALASIVYLSLNTATLQLGGVLQGRGEPERFRALTRWAVGAHLAAGTAVLAAMAVLGGLPGLSHTGLAPWLVVGTVSILDAAADGLAVRLVLVEGWAPMGRLRLLFQFIGPPLGLVFLFSGLGITGIFLGDGVAAAGLLAMTLRRFRRLPGAGAPHTARLRSGFTAPEPVARTWTLFSLSAIVTQVVSRRVEFVVLALFATESAIAMYSVAFMVINLIAIVPLGVAAAAMPVVAAAEQRGETGRAEYHLRMALRLGTAISVVIVAFLCVLGPEAITLIYGVAYNAGASLVPLASLSLLTAVVTGVCTQYWSGQKRLGIVLSSGLTAAVVDLVVALIAIPHLSAEGAVLANLAGQVSLGVAMLVATVRASGAIGWRWNGLYEVVIVSGCAAIAAASARIVVNHEFGLVDAELRAGISLLAGAIVAAAVIGVVAPRVKLFDSEEAAWLAAVIPLRLHPILSHVTEHGG